MQFSVVALFAASALAASVETKTAISTQVNTITSCAETEPSCPARNSTASTSIYTGAADFAHGSYYAAGAAVLAAGALLI